MKNFTPKSGFLILSIINLLFALITSVSWSQSTGDYKSERSGTWSTLDTWKRYDGTGWSAPTSLEGYPGQYSIPGIVTMMRGTSVSLDVSPSNSIGSLEFEFKEGDASLSILNSNSLIVGGNIAFNSTTSVNNTHPTILDIGNGNLSCFSFTINFDSANNAASSVRRTQVMISNGTLSVLQNISLSQSVGSGTSGIAVSGAGSVNVGGSFMTGSKGAFTAGGGTVNFNGTTAQIVNVNEYNFNNIKVNNTSVGGATLGGSVSSMNVTGDLIIGDVNSGSLLKTNNLPVGRGNADKINLASGSVLDLGTTSISWNSAGGVIKIDGTLKTSNPDGFSGTGNSAIANTNTPMILLGSNSKIEYNAMGNQTVTAREYLNLSLSGLGTKTFASGGASIKGNFSITGVVVNLGSSNSATVSLTLGGVSQNVFSWGSTASGAVHKNSDYFGLSSIGILNPCPVFTAGAINVSGQTICYGGDPSLISNSAPASGGDGSLNYKWQANGVDVPNSNSESFDPPSGLTANTIYTRWAKDNTCSSTYSKSSGNFEVKVEPQPLKPTLFCWQTAMFNSSTCSWEISGTQSEKPEKVNCWDDYQFDSTICSWVNQGSQSAKPSNENCWDDYQFDSTKCAWVNLGSQSAKPSNENCWDDYQFDSTICSWVNLGSQSAKPSNENCWDDYQFDSTICSWVNLGSQNAKPEKENCWDDYQFDSTKCSWVNQGSQSAKPSNENCWDDYQFDSTKCAWVNLGSQNAKPEKENCWDDYQFDSTKCSWVNQGSQSAKPSNENCWDDYQFDSTKCAWVNHGSQSAKPSNENCWDDYQFDSTICSWVNLGSQSAKPSNENCWDDYQFDSTICSWVNLGSQSAKPSNENCWDDYQFDSTICSWVNHGSQLQKPSKENCWDDYQFDSMKCSWVNQGSQRAKPSKENCWDDYQFDSTKCSWVNHGSQRAKPSNENCWDDYQFDSTICSWVNQGSQSAKPSNENCWDDYQFDSTICSWVNLGSQSAKPSNENCWDDYQFDSTICSWVNLGSQKAKPSNENCWDDYKFDTTICSWANLGSQSAKPEKENCWDDYQFDSTTCTWVNRGSQNAKPEKENCWDDYQFDSTKCSWVNQGSQRAKPEKENCWDDYQFDSTICSWVNRGPQTAKPEKENCWDDYQFDSTKCAWVNRGSQNAKPEKENCWDDYQFDSTKCSWVNQSSQSAKPSNENCWDDYQFDSTKCSWINLGSQRAKPSNENCWDDHQFDSTKCVWVNLGSQRAKPSNENCWDDYQFDSTICSWVNHGSQRAKPEKVNCWDDYQFDSTKCSWVNQGSQSAKPEKENCWDDYQFDSIKCSWVNQGYQSTKPSNENCWDDYQFDSKICSWVNLGSQIAKPEKANCWDDYQFDSIKCAWVNIGKITPPVLSGRPDNITVECDSIPSPPSMEAKDICGVERAVAFISTSTQGNNSKKSSYYNYSITRTWTAFDSYGNKASHTQVITVVDKTGPVLSAEPSDVVVQSNSVPAVPVIQASDKCSGSSNVTLTTSTINASDASPCSYTLVRNWSAADLCGNTTTHKQTITVNVKPNVKSIAGDSKVCSGSSIQLTNQTLGGIWTSSNTSIATVNSKGQVTGVLAGSVKINYTVGCSGTSVQVQKQITINDSPTVMPINGPSQVDIGNPIVFSNPTSGGVWSSSDTSVATVNKNGLVQRKSAGTVTITYTVTNKDGCLASVYKILAGSKTAKNIDSEHYEQLVVTAYPNPASDRFIVEIENMVGKDVSLIVYDMLGRVVKQISTNYRGPVSFGEELQAANYIVVIRQGMNQKIIKLTKK